MLVCTYCYTVASSPPPSPPIRAMLMKRKVKQKKVVVKQIEWLEKPVDVMVQERRDERAVFTARLSEKEKKGKWYFRNNVSVL